MVFKPGRDGEPVPWQPCCDPYRRETIFVAAKLYIFTRAILHNVFATSCCGYDDKGPPWPQG